MVTERKPFVSTVRTGYYQPPLCCDNNQERRENRCRCPCRYPRKGEVLLEIERLQVETQNQNDVIEAYKKQIDYRDREIQRLGALLAGGRPAAALAKDCCYKNISTLSIDVEKLQSEKMTIQNQLQEVLDSQQNASKKIQKLSERNRLLEQELKEIENVALNVESEANLNILDRDKQNSDLRLKLQQSNIRIKELETLLEVKSLQTGPSSSSASLGSADFTLNTALKQSSEEKRVLYTQLNELRQREQTLLCDYEKLKNKYWKTKLKLSNNHEEVQHDSSRWKDKFAALEESHKTMKSELDFLSDENKQLRESLLRLQRNFTEKDMKISQLESELSLSKKGLNCGGRLKTADSATSAQSSLSVQSAFHRVERERDAAKREVQQLEIERNSLRDKLKLATKSQQEEKAKHEEVILGYSAQIANLEAEKRDLLCGQNSSHTTVQLVREENQDLKKRLKESEDNFSKLKTSHSQLKILQDQTERALTQQQSRLLCSENQLDSAEAKLCEVDGTIENAHKDISKLRGDIKILKASNASLQHENDKLLAELDKKTEKLFVIEAELSNYKTERSGMRDTINRLQKKLE
ncbi:centrosomal protein of 135 kDa [Uranotaenia lowii]|uniref:centrosomal protein of 135 kDa n=1 Tax=Uranotaenia lowii TaxID=190385 RepID=UPI00247899FB|nr:centrosomal protein of 135 kDa [Uranotaenia lowii]